ncbi:hypothetical protein ABIA52_004171 [Paenarthrobacter histidinolovorans]|uniref:Uncharacterized protein n=1 Tax=Paenarthrobacter histidinolovorans TaxID=43664 RepID=A0ABW8NCG5_9MICC
MAAIPLLKPTCFPHLWITCGYEGVVKWVTPENQRNRANVPIEADYPRSLG